MVFADRAGPRIALVQAEPSWILGDQADQIEYAGPPEDARKSQADQGWRKHASGKRGIIGMLLHCQMLELGLKIF